MMERKTLTNAYTGEYVGEIDGNIVRTPVGTYRVGDTDLQWLICEAPKRWSFSAMDVRAVGFKVYDEQVVLRIHHYECNTEDDYIKITTGPDVPEQQVIAAFEDALRTTQREAEQGGCRFSWLDSTIAVLRKQFPAVEYRDKGPEDCVINLDWSKFQPQ